MCSSDLPLPSSTCYQPDELQVLVWLSFHLGPSTSLSVSSPQMSSKHSSGLFFFPQPFTSTLLTISISPDKRQVLVWAPNTSFFAHFPSHIAQMSACRLFGLSFHLILPLYLPQCVINQTSYKCSSGRLFILVPPPLSQSHQPR